MSNGSRFLSSGAEFLLAVIATVLSLALAAPAAAQDPQSRRTCREMRTLDALEYWFWDAFSGFVQVQDFGQERVGRFEIDRGICFRIAVATLENPQQKNAGYRQAVSELIMWLADGSAERATRRRVRRQLERVTGEDFDDYAEWNDWWEEHRDFVLWSDDEERLVVVTSAMEAGEVIHNDAIALSAEEYWFYSARGWVPRSEPVGRYMLGSVLIPPHDFTFRVLVEELEDRGAKERGYRRALENLIVDGLMAPGLEGERLDRLFDQLALLTGERYPGRDAWVDWWERNGHRLVLSPAGDRLVVER